MAKDLADLVVSLELQSAKYQAGFDQATSRLKKFHKDTEDGLKGIADLFAAYLSADAVIEFAKKTLDASGELANFSKSTGIAVEALSALQFAAKAGGVDTEGLNGSLKKLNVALSDASGNASGKAGLAFQLMGINIRDASGHLKDANTIFNQMADVFAKTADGPNKVALAVAILGKEGEKLIPTLDKGSKGLKELADQAAAAGAIIDGPTAEAANAFNDKLNLLKATLVDGLGAQVERALLPVLNALADDFLGTATKADNMRVIVDEVTTGFKLLITAGLIVKEIFSQIGDAIGGAIAAAEAAGGPLGRIVDAFKAGGVGAAAAAAGAEAYAGSFKKSMAILDDQSAHASKSAEDTANAILDVWNKVSTGVGKAVGDTADSTKKTLGSLSGLIAFDAAKKELQAFVDGLQGEVAKLDQGRVAATNYALSHGKLKDALKATGVEGEKLKNQAIAAATQLETIEVNKQIEGLQIQLKALSGDTAGAALDSFAKSVEQLTKQLHDVGGATEANGLAVIDNLKQATAYQQAFNLLQTNAARINQDAALAEQAINNKLLAGQITSLEAERELQKVRADTITQLEGIKHGEDDIAAAANQPALTQGAKQFGGQIDALKAKTDTLTNSVRAGLESAFANNFSDLITGAKSFGDAITGLLKDVEKQFADLVAKNFAQQLFGAASGSSSGGAAGGLAPFLAGLFGGAHADGGTIPEGKIGLVGERGPELIMGAAGGTAVTPNHALGGVTVNNKFIIQSQNGEISRPSQMQTAAAVSRSLAMASRRNN